MWPVLMLKKELKEDPSEGRQWSVGRVEGGVVGGKVDYGRALQWLPKQKHPPSFSACRK